MSSHYDLHILRHAHALDTSKYADIDRPLSPRGIQQCEDLAYYLHQHQIKFEYCLTSTATRAMTTAVRVLTQMSYQTQILHCDPILYEARYQTILETIQQIPADYHQVLITGHNHSLQDLVHYLTHDDDYILHKAERVQIQCKITDRSQITDTQAHIVQSWRPQSH